MARRRFPRPTLTGSEPVSRMMVVPESSGPRWANERVARSRSSGASRALRARMPTMPHTRWLEVHFILARVAADVTEAEKEQGRARRPSPHVLAIFAYHTRQAFSLTIF